MPGLPWGGGGSRTIKRFSLRQVEASGTSSAEGKATVYLSDSTPHLEAGQGTQPERACDACSWGGGSGSHPHPAGFGSCSLTWSWPSHLSLPAGGPAFWDSAWYRLCCQTLGTLLSFLNKGSSTCPDVRLLLPITFLSVSRKPVCLLRWYSLPWSSGVCFTLCTCQDLSPQSP